MGPGAGRGAWRSGRAEPQGPGWRGWRAPAADVREPQLCRPVCLSVGRRVRLSAPRVGAAGRNPGKRALLTCSRRRPGSGHPGLPRGPPRRVGSRAGLGERSWEPREKPAPLPLSFPWAPPPSPIPKRSPRSLAGCLEGSGPARAGGGRGRRRRGGGRRGVLFGDGEGVERERPRGRPHPADSPGAGHRGRAPCLPPPGSARPGCKPRRDCDSRGPWPQAQHCGALGGVVRGVEGRRASPGRPEAGRGPVS